MRTLLAIALLLGGCGGTHDVPPAKPVPAPAAEIPHCGKLDGALTRDVDVLDHRITLRVPKNGEQLARKFDVMGAPKPVAEETRIMIGGGASAGEAPGDDALVVLARETWQLVPEPDPAHPATLADEAAKFLQAVYGKDLTVAPMKVADGSVKVFAGTPSKVGSQGDAALVLAMLIALPDGTLQSMSFHISNGIVDAAKPCTTLAQQIAQSIKVGSRTLDRTAGRRDLGRLTATVPADYAMIHQQGPDFDVYRLFHLRPLSQFPGSLIVALDEHPQPLEEVDHEESGKLLGKTVKWKGRRSAKGGILAAQTALPGSRMQVQAVAQATRDETYLDEFKKVAESLVVARP